MDLEAARMNPQLFVNKRIVWKDVQGMREGRVYYVSPAREDFLICNAGDSNHWVSANVSIHKVIRILEG